MSSYLKAMQLTKYLEEMAKEDKRNRINAEENIGYAQTLFEIIEYMGYEIPDTSTEYLKIAKSLLSDKNYIASIVYSGLAIVAEENPEKANEILNIYEEMKTSGIITNNSARNEDRQMGRILVGKVNKYVEKAVGLSIEKTKQHFEEYEKQQRIELEKKLKEL